MRLVINLDPLWTGEEGWRTTDEPVLRIGLVDGPEAYLFSGTMGVTRLSDGTIVVLDGGSRQLRAFAEDGAHLWSAGGRGRGPGEISSVGRLSWLEGDVLQVEDGRLEKRVRFDGRGQLIEDVPVNWATLLERGWVHPPVGCASLPVLVGDNLLVGQACDMPSQTGMYTAGVLLTVIPWSMERIDTLGWFGLVDEWGYRAMPGWLGLQSGFGKLKLPGPLPQHRFAIGGQPPSILAYARFDRYRIHVYDLRSAELRQIIDRPRAMRVSTGEERAEWWAAFDRAAETDRRLLEREGASVSSLMAELSNAREQVADSLSLGGRMVYDRQGNLWVENRPDAVPATGSWSVFRTDGIYLGDVATPAGLDLREIGDDYLLGIVYDSLTVPSVVMLGLIRDR